MDITKISIKRPVALIMCVLIVMVLGGVSLSKLPLDLMPKMTAPVMLIMTNYSNAGPYEVESLVTKPLEGAVSTVSDVKNVSSTSTEGSSIIIVEFTMGIDMDYASLQVRDKVDMIKSMLPDDADTPMVLKLDISSLPIVSVIATPKKDVGDIRAMVKDKIQPRLERLNGIAAANLMGGQEKEIRVELDMDKLSGMGLSISQIAGLLASENMNLPGGNVDYGDSTLSVRAIGEFDSVEDVSNVPITLPAGGMIHIRDIASVYESYKEETSLMRLNGKDCIALSLQRSSDGNTVSAVRNVRSEVEKLRNDYPEIQFDIVNDQAEFIEYTISGVVNNLIMGGILAIIVLFVFLRNFSMTVVIALSIPISVIATFVMIFFSGTTLNAVSLGGLALGIGMLVDNSIVVMESIYRYRKEGQNRISASLLGTKEVRAAVFASTLTTIVVFLPIVFTEGIITQIFRDMALTVTFSLASSLIVAVTLVPMLCSKLVRNVEPVHAPKAIGFLNIIMDFFTNSITSMTNAYERLLKKALKYRKSTIAISLAAFIAAMAAFPIVGMEFMPAVDEGQIQITAELPNGSSLSAVDECAAAIEQYLIGIPEMDSVIVSIGGNNFMMGTTSNAATIYAILVNKNERDKSTDDICDEIRTELSKIAGAKISVAGIDSTMGGGMAGSAISYDIRGDDMEVLHELSEELVLQISNIEGAREVTSSVSEGVPEIDVNIDRDKAAFYGLSAVQIASNVRLALEGKVATALKVNGSEVDVRLTFPDSMTNSYERLSAITLRTPSGGDIPLFAVADIEQKMGPVSISRYNQERYVTVTGSVYGVDMNSVNKAVESIISQMNLPNGYTVEVSGQSELLIDTVNSLMLMLILAVLLVYMVMAAQFESLTHPFVILFAIPLAIIGSVIFLLLSRQALSVPGIIGIILLVGIVVNNAIVLIDYINQLRRQRGMGMNEAIMMAGPIRLRPILMTALTTILALIPMVFSTADGAELEKNLSLVVMGGLISSTFLTLFVVPVIYTYLDSFASRVVKRFGGGKKDGEGTDCTAGSTELINE